MKRIFVGLLGLLLCAGGAGCQPTPEQEIVVKKDMDRMLAQAAQSDNGAFMNDMNIPEGRYRFSAEELNGRVRINVDAEIIKPTA